jgi:hypothetical protein
MSDLQRRRAAEAKRERRRLRNIESEASQGRYPEEAKCGCGKWGEINYDDGSFRGYFCGGSQWCCP